MSPIVHSKPVFTKDEAIKICNTYYNFQVKDVKDLPSERDQNFLIRDFQENKYVLKIADAKVDADTLDFQNKAMQYTGVKAKENTSIRVPTLQNAVKSNSSMVQIENHESHHYIRLVSYLEGEVFAKFSPHTISLMESFGRFLANLTNSLDGFDHLSVHREFYWDLAKFDEVVTDYLPYVKDKQNHELISYYQNFYNSEVKKAYSQLPESVIHNDCNDYNVIVDIKSQSGNISFGVIDFGDMVYSKTIHELAIGSAYAILNKENPLQIIRAIVKGYLKQRNLTQVEIDCLFPLICSRLAMSVAISSFQMTQEPDNEYLVISQKPALDILYKLRSIHPRFARYAIRYEAGYPISDEISRLTDLISNKSLPTSFLFDKITPNNSKIIDLSVSSNYFDFSQLSNTSQLTEGIVSRLEKYKDVIGIGRTCEVRLSHLNSHSIGIDQNYQNSHLGVDFFTLDQIDIHAPYAGTVYTIKEAENTTCGKLTVILEHEIDGQIFWSSYKGISNASVSKLQNGDRIDAGDIFCQISSIADNDGLTPHLHFQIILDDLGLKGDFPDFVDHRDIGIWSQISPDPNLLLKMGIDLINQDIFSLEHTKSKRNQFLGYALSISYKRPLKIVRGYMQYLFDFTGRRFLDAVNNVPHIGHSNPVIVNAMYNQARTLNTNTRYFHDIILEYSHALLSTLPEDIRDEYRCYFVNSGSEANELALRLARNYVGSKHTVVLDGAYHGNTQGLIEISPYKFNGPGGEGKPEFITILDMPYPYRGKYTGYGTETTEKYLEDARSELIALEKSNIQVAGFISESIMGVGGQIVYPDGYLNGIYEIIRSNGGVCIADEVQIGFGRVGTHFWGFETQGVIPDIITLGKPIGNGHPLGAVLVRREISAAFDNGMEYFNTFGGNPVSCAVGLAVFNYIKDHNLQLHALDTGDYFKSQLEKICENNHIIGEIRGSGLFLGIEIVKNISTKEPSPADATYIVNRMRDMDILVSTDGPDHNVIKIKPPIVFSRFNVDTFVNTFSRILDESYLNWDQTFE